MKKNCFFIILLLCLGSFAFSDTISDYAIVYFNAKEGVDVGFSKNSINMESKIMPPFLGADDEIIIDLDGFYWSSDPFYLNVRVYTQKKVEITLKTFALTRYVIDLAGTQAGYDSLKYLAWENTSNDSPSSNTGIDLANPEITASFPYTMDNNIDTTVYAQIKLLNETELGIDTLKTRYYSFPFKIQVSDSNKVEGYYYRTALIATVETVE